MRHATAAATRIQKGRTTLLLDHPFFGSLLFRLKGRETSSVKTMATDGVSLFYNPEFVATLSAPELNGVLAHEVLHPALQHHLRRGGRSPVRWNKACDFAINPLLLDAGLILPKDVLIDNRFRGMSAEHIYNLLEEEDEGGGNSQQSEDPQESSQSNSNGSGGAEREANAPETPGGFGQVLDAPVPDDAAGQSAEEQARDWQIAVEQAQTISKLAGKLPAGVERSLEGAKEARVDWRELLRRAWSETTPSDYSWMRPNRRHIWQGLYLPGIQREGVGDVVIFVDCSGSINARQLSLFEAEVRSILEGQRPDRVYVAYFDACVHKVDIYEAGQQIRLMPVGGGGTDFRPCFEWLEENQVQPQTLVFLTDLYGTLPKTAPPYPVLWASTGARRAPFGQVVPMQAA
ncbi:putative metal-dependent peptidase [Silvibacterium bohemicum]|uniref:Putative metal-dependent peptidase n=1 Tax=Silvibacterium bohemicum TaxID=1577686 RepID=A0A841K0D8_9BACT|nr:VWA-like domain-containing protein [Silvibacterium bohemicum]MBB6143704.1 putative metal-dependent peptidase [Silvibacterium bohemicum]